MAWCEENTEHAPFARPGLSYHWAEMHARVGNRAETVQYLERAADSPGFERWPHRHVVDEALADVDGLLDRFAAVGEDGSAFDIVYANQDYGCVFCHAPAP